jgi:hypothetical protein
MFLAQPQMSEGAPTEIEFGLLESEAVEQQKERFGSHTEAPIPRLESAYHMAVPIKE